RHWRCVRAHRSQSTVAAVPGGSETVRSEPAIPSTDGLRRGNEDDRALREGAWPRRSLGAANREDKQRLRGLFRSSLAHLSACAERSERLLQPRQTCVALWLLPRFYCRSR